MLAASGFDPSTKGNGNVAAQTPRHVATATNTNTINGNNIVEDKDKEINIQVVVRCRAVSEKEKSEKITNVISVPLFSGNQVQYRASNSTVKTFTFDKVFGPNADQETIYKEVAQPILKEVMQGYNCTIFAYGQTGTGKTYTMEGNMSTKSLKASPNVGVLKGFDPDRLVLKDIPSEAGIIPRVLQRMFYLLDQSSAEYSVRVSHLELYNEELRDLLATSDSDDSSFQTNNSGFGNDPSRIRLYDDGAGKGGVIIQGLEEILVSNAHHAIKLLQQGSQKRQVASTKCNDVSSRSHSIFMLTVHIKEKLLSSTGEDLIKIGKLNLVDLAGSENIGRSGAEMRRAREAGMINQSLLTLGRVINSLVDRSVHVPYRESKLTRLLRDSLGGRTRTCLIATISPSKSNIEETISTLDYANRAKSIKNRPEANKKVTQTALVSDLQQQIERLQMDLSATHSKHGVYLAQERYKQLLDDLELKTQQAEEWKDRVQDRENELQKIHNEARLLYDKCTDMQAEIELKSSELERATSKIDSLTSSLRDTENLLMEQRFLAKIYKQNEEKLDITATKLANASFNASSTISKLKSRLVDISEIDKKRELLLDQFQTKSEAAFSELAAAIKAFQPSISSHISSITTEFKNSVEQVLGAKVDQELVDLAELFESSTSQEFEKLEASLEHSSANISAALSSITENKNTTAEKIRVNRANATALNSSAIKEAISKLSGIEHEATSILKNLTSLTNKSSVNFKNSAKRHKGQIDGFLSSIEETSKSSKIFLESQAASLSQLHAEMVEQIKQQNQQIIAEIQQKLMANQELQSKRLTSFAEMFKASSEPVLSKLEDLATNKDEFGTSAEAFLGIIDEQSTSINAAIGECGPQIVTEMARMKSLAQNTFTEVSASTQYHDEKQAELMAELDELINNDARLVNTRSTELHAETCDRFESIVSSSKHIFNKQNSLIVNSKTEMNRFLGSTLSTNLTFIKADNDELCTAVSKETQNMNSSLLELFNSMTKSDKNLVLRNLPEIVPVGVDFRNLSWDRTKAADFILEQLRSSCVRALESKDSSKEKSEVEGEDRYLDIEPDIEFAIEKVRVEFPDHEAGNLDISTTADELPLKPANEQIENRLSSELMSSAEKKRKFSNIATEGEFKLESSQEGKLLEKGLNLDLTIDRFQKTDILVGDTSSEDPDKLTTGNTDAQSTDAAVDLFRQTMDDPPRETAFDKTQTITKKAKNTETEALDIQVLARGQAQARSDLSEQDKSSNNSKSSRTRVIRAPTRTKRK